MSTTNNSDLDSFDQRGAATVESGATSGGENAQHGFPGTAAPAFGSFGREGVPAAGGAPDYRQHHQHPPPQGAAGGPGAGKKGDSGGAARGMKGAVVSGDGTAPPNTNGGSAGGKGGRFTGKKGGPQPAGRRD